MEIQIYILDRLKTHIQLWVARDTAPCGLYITTLAACYLDMVVQKRIVLEIYVHTTVLVCFFSSKMCKEQ